MASPRARIVAECIFVAGLSALSTLAFPLPLLGSLLASVGGNWTASLVQRGYERGSRILHGFERPLNHDLQRVVLLAFQKALRILEEEWWQTPAGSELARADRDHEAVIRGQFAALRDHARQFFADEQIGKLGHGQVASDLLNLEDAAVAAALRGYVEEYFSGQPRQLTDFVVQHLAQALRDTFAEELKTDLPLNNRAWRAYQRLIYHDLSAQCEAILEQQEQHGARLDEFASQVRQQLGEIDAQLRQRPEELRVPFGQVGLEQLCAGLRDEMVTAIAAEGERTRAAVGEGLEQLSRLLGQELQAIRLVLIDGLDTHGLSSDAPPLPLDSRRLFDRLLTGPGDYDLFGGRGGELDAMREFLSSPDGGYLYITGPAGYGKTALLLEQVRRQHAISFHFINRALGTTQEDLCLRNLCQQLAVRHGLGGRLPSEISLLRDLYLALLKLPPGDGRPAIVVLDGLDEAVGWDPKPLMFPPCLAAGVKVIFAGRAAPGYDWPARLDLPESAVRRLTLGVMTPHEVAAMVRAAGGSVAAHAGDAAWLSGLMRVSRGDPFYVKLLVDDLRSGRLLPAQVNLQPTGLKKYLSGWWREVQTAARATDVQHLLGTLAVAVGPIGRADLIGIHPDLEWGLDGVLEQVGRFVTGDAAGYALCHPRFAAYVREHVAGQTDASLEALLAYCTRWDEHATQPEQGRRYAPRYLAAHLAEAGRWQELHTLLATGSDTQRFAEARRDSDGSYDGYLADLALLWDHAEAEAPLMPETLGHLARYALIRASINTLAANVPPDLAVALLREGIWNAHVALANARQIPGVPEQLATLERLIPALVERGEEWAAEEAVDLATAAIRVSTVPEGRPRAIAEFAARLPPAYGNGMLENVLADADVGGSLSARIEARIGIIPYLTGGRRTEMLREVWALLHGVRLTAQPDRHLASPASLLPFAGSPSATADGEDESRWADVLVPLIQRLPAQEMETHLPTMLEMIREVDQPGSVPALLSFPQAGRRPTKEAPRVRILRALIVHLPTQDLPSLVDYMPAAMRASLSFNADSWADLLLRIIKRLPTDQRWTIMAPAFEQTRQMSMRGQRLFFEGVFPLLPTEHLAEAMITSTEIAGDEPSVHRSIMEGLLGSLPAQPTPALLTLVMAEIDRLPDTLESLSTLLDRLSAPDQRAQVLEAILNSVVNGVGGLREFSGLEGTEPPLARQPLPKLSASSKQSSAKGSASRYLSRYSVVLMMQKLGALAARLSATELPAFLGGVLAALDIDPPFDSEVLCPLAAALTLDQRQAIQTAVLAEADGDGSAPSQLFALARLAPLPYPNTAEERAATAALLADLLPERDQRAAAQAVLSETGLLPPAAANAVLPLARTIPSPRSRALALAILAWRLPPPQLAAALEEALAIADAIDDEHVRSEALATLAPHLPLAWQPSTVARALRLAATPAARIDLLAALLPRLDTARQVRVIAAAVALAGGSGETAALAETLAPAIPLAPVEQQRTLLSHLLMLAAGTDARVLLTDVPPTVSHERPRIPGMLPHPVPLLYELLAETLPHLAADRQASVVTGVLTLLRQLGDTALRADTLSRVVSYLPAEMQPVLVIESLVSAASSSDTQVADRVIRRLARHSSGLLAELRERLPDDQGDQRFFVRLLMAQLSSTTGIGDAWECGLSGEVLFLGQYLVERYSPKTKLTEVEYHPERADDATNPDLVAFTKERGSHSLVLAHRLPDSEPSPRALLNQQHARRRPDPVPSLQAPTEEQHSSAFAAACAIAEVQKRSKALANLMPSLSQVPDERIRALWASALRQCAVRKRPDLLRDLEQLSQLIPVLVEDAAEERATTLKWRERLAPEHGTRQQGGFVDTAGEQSAMTPGQRTQETLDAGEREGLHPTLALAIWLAIEDVGHWWP